MSVFQPLFELPPVFQEITWPTFHNAGVTVIVLREDLRHPVLGGNKLWKLKYNFEEFTTSGASAMASFGGAYSNHLAALSEACCYAGILLHVFIRGEEQPVNERIKRMLTHGTTVHYVSREDYRNKEHSGFLRSYLLEKGWTDQQLSSLYVLPEGGNNEAGRAGCKGLGELIPRDTNIVACACGTGGTLSGMLHGISMQTIGLGIQVVRDEKSLMSLMATEGHSASRYRILPGYEMGGYGKNSTQLQEFMQQFSTATAVPLEHVYTGKLFFALDDLARKNYFHRGEKLVVVHTGGLY